MKKILVCGFLTSAAVHCSSTTMVSIRWMNECAWFIMGLGHMDLSNVFYVKALPLPLRNLRSQSKMVENSMIFPICKKYWGISFLLLVWF